MEDFEYSVEICDRDWECFFAECEECNLLPPSLAGVDESGMSDFDEAASILAKRVQKVDLTAGFSEVGQPVDGPPDCEGSPVEHYLSKHAVGGMESVLSGSEEDIHLQSVNIFFEQLKNLTEADGPSDPSQVKDGKSRELIHQEEEHCSDGTQASGSLPKNIPVLNSLPANGEAAVGEETAGPVDTIGNINTMKKDVLGSNISPEPTASNLVLKTNKSAGPEMRLFIIEEACTETKVNEATKLNQSHDSLEGAVYSKTLPHPEKVITAETCTPLDDAKQEDFLTCWLTLSKKSSTDSSSNHDTVMHVKRKEIQNTNILQLDATRTYKTTNQELSPSASIKRKRRKKRRLNVEPAESVHGYERQLLLKQSDSEEEQYAWRGRAGLNLSDDIYLSHLNQAQNEVASFLTTRSATSNLPVKPSAEEIHCLPHYSPLCDRQYQYLTGLAENNTTNDGDRVNSLSQPNNSDNVATNLQPCSGLHEEQSPGLPVSLTDCVTGKSDLDTEKEICGRKDLHAGLRQSDKINNSSICCEDENKPKPCAAEVKSISILPSTKSNDPSVEVSQSDKLSAAKLVLAVEAGNPGEDTHRPCDRETEPQQQLEVYCQDTDQYRSTMEKANIPLSASSSDAHNTKPQKVTTRASPVYEEVSSGVGCAKLPSDTSDVSKGCLANHSSSEDVNVLSDKNTADEKMQIVAFQSEYHSCEINLTDKRLREPKLSPSTTSPSSITPSLTDSQTGPEDQGTKSSLLLAEREEGNGTSQSNDLLDSKCDLMIKEEDVTTALKAECELEKAPASKPSLFAMSSFWNEMEKLTINDILGLRMIGKAVPPNSLPPLQESDETDLLAGTDSGYFSQLGESKPEQTNEDMPSDLNSVESSPGSVTAVDSSSLGGVSWESLGADTTYPDNMTLTSFGDISQLALPNGPQKHLRKISKNVSVHNLHALKSESFGYKTKDQHLQTLDNRDLHKVEHLTDEQLPSKDKDLSSYRISLTNIFQYLFSGNQSTPCQSDTDNITCYTDGNSVAESYDHFFSEFDTESFFYPLTEAEDQSKDQLVPIISCSRSANRNLQFPEAYEYFFPSSSSDESSAESDDEDTRGPVNVVTRFNRTSSSSQISTDMYDQFYRDSDLGQNFFWKTMLSFRNVNLTGSTVQKQTLSNTLACVPVRQSSTLFESTVHPSSALTNQDVMFKLPFRYDDTQMALSNPRLDASLLPLKQSEMCLVCIAFASWVLKTANPQVGDTWKAVLLANISALSAIRYLRKDVKMKAAASGKKLNDTPPPCDS